MEPLSLLANLLLSVTVGTLMVALVAYIAYKLRENRKPSTQPAADFAEDDTLVFLRPYVPDAEQLSTARRPGTNAGARIDRP